MSTLIDPTYFDLDVNIPNSTANDKVQSYINKFEPIFLEKLLGYTLYASLKAGASTQRMVRLIDGFGSWKGLRQVSEKTSIIAYYVFYFYTQTTVAQSTGLGSVIIVPKGGVAISSEEKMIWAWNFMSVEVKECMSFLISNIGDYPEITNFHVLKTLKSFRKINLFGI